MAACWTHNVASPDFTEHCNQFSAKPPPALPKAKAPASRLASLTRWHPQQGDIPTEVSSPASCHHQQVVVTSKLSSPASWHHHQGGITIKVASPARWHHQQGGISSKWLPHQGGITSKVASPARWPHQQGGITSKRHWQRCFIIRASINQYTPAHSHPSATPSL